MPARIRQDIQSLQAVGRYISEEIRAIPADPESLFQTIQRIFHDTVRWTGNQSEPVRIQFTGGVADPDGDNIVALGDEIFHAALIRRATDVHIEPASSEVLVRMRVDGRLEDYRRLPNSIQSALVSRFKVMAGMDIAERRAPQDGRFTLQSEQSNEIDIRAATIPTKHGERMTLRLLAMQTHDLTFGKLGMAPEDLSRFERAIHRPNGLIVLTGPTGCGKSTTLYAALRNLLQMGSQNIITIEDPVEYVIDGISQVEVDTTDKVSFHKALRSALRHDPDVLMIGEIRDEETAETAIRAALTGHLVFTTLHANSAIGAITRLTDMGIKPYLTGAVGRMFAAQRLVRRLCKHCRRPRSLKPIEAAAFGEREFEADAFIYEPIGCEYCAGAGFMGQIALFEFVPFDLEIATLVAEKPKESALQSLLNQRGHKSLVDDGLKKLFAGDTSFEEVTAVISPY